MAEHDCEVLKVFVNDQTYHRQNQDAAKLRASIRRLLNAGSGGAECVAARNEATHLLEKS